MSWLQKYLTECGLERVNENDFHSAFDAKKKQWDHCICSQGDYFEGDDSQN
jgi:hypothetical protein